MCTLLRSRFLAPCKYITSVATPVEAQHSSFALQDSEWQGERCITIEAGCSTEAERTTAVGELLQRLRDGGHISGWRDELYPVVTRFGAQPSLLVERAAAHLFGIKAYGVHMNGFVRQDDGLHLWVATRSASKPTWPGKYDHLAAGGQVRCHSCDGAQVSHVHLRRSRRTALCASALSLIGVEDL